MGTMDDTLTLETTMSTTTEAYRRLTGYDAIEYAERAGLTLSKYADPTEAARDSLTPDEAREIAAEDPSLIYVEIPRATHVEIYEDNGGGLWFRPVGQGVVIEMPATGDALSDCRLYGTDWTASECPEAVFPEAELLRHEPRHVATYRPGSDRLEIETTTPGSAAQSYLGVDEVGEPHA